MLQCPFVMATAKLCQADFDSIPRQHSQSLQPRLQVAPWAQNESMMQQLHMLAGKPGNLGT